MAQSSKQDYYFSTFDTHKAFKVFADVNFTQEQSEALVNFLNQQSIAQAQLLGKDDFQQTIDTKADKADIKTLIQQMDKKSDEHRADIQDLIQQTNTKADKTDIQALIQQIDKNASEHREQLNKKAEKDDVKALIQQINTKADKKRRRTPATHKQSCP